jgi:hypothetical protein
MFIYGYILPESRQPKILQDAYVWFGRCRAVAVGTIFLMASSCHERSVGRRYGDRRHHALPEMLRRGYDKS